MKLCFIAVANSIHSIKWINYFAEKGHEVHWIISSPKINAEYHPKIILHDFHNLSKFTLLKFCFKDIKNIIEQIKPDIVHSHYAGMNGLLGALSSFHPFVVTVWGSDILISGKSIIKGPFVKYILKKADLITTDADHMKEATVKLGINSDKIKIIYFGIDTKKFNSDKKSDNFKTKLKIGNRPIIISLRNFELVYDLKSLIYAIPIIIKKFPQAMFLLAGRGPEKNNLKELSKKLHIENNVRFIGFIPNDKLPIYLASSDVYVSTSLSDAGIAASTAEAMACCISVVITDSGENKKWIKNGKNGFIVPVKNPEKLAEKIINLLRNNNRRREMGLESRKTISERNDYYKEMGKMEKLYKGLISKNK